MEFAAWLTTTAGILQNTWTTIKSCYTTCCQQEAGNDGNTATASPTPHSGPAAESVPLTSNTEETAAGDDGPTPGPSVPVVTKQPSPKPLLPTQNDTEKSTAKPLPPTHNDIKQPSAKPSPAYQNDIKQPSETPLLPTPKNTHTNETNIPTINVPTTNDPVIHSSITNNPTIIPTIQNNPSNSNSQPITNNPIFTFHPINENNPVYTNNSTYIHNPTETYEHVTSTDFGLSKPLQMRKLICRSELESQVPSIEWVRTNIEKVLSLRQKAIVGGYDTDGSDLWIIKTTIEGEIRPAKFSHGKNKAFVTSLVEDTEKEINVFEVCCVQSRQKTHITWEKSGHGNVPENAVIGGETSDGKPLYIGRKIIECSRCPGMIRPDDKCLYLSYDGKLHKFDTYEVMCWS